MSLGVGLHHNSSLISFFSNGQPFPVQTHTTSCHLFLLLAKLVQGHQILRCNMFHLPTPQVPTNKITSVTSSTSATSSGLGGFEHELYHSLDFIPTSHCHLGHGDQYHEAKRCDPQWLRVCTFQPANTTCKH